MELKRSSSVPTLEFAATSTTRSTGLTLSELAATSTRSTPSSTSNLAEGEEEEKVIRNVETPRLEAAESAATFSTTVAEPAATSSATSSTTHGVAKLHIINPSGMYSNAKPPRDVNELSELSGDDFTVIHKAEDIASNLIKDFLKNEDVLADNQLAINLQEDGVVDDELAEGVGDVSIKDAKGEGDDEEDSADDAAAEADDDAAAAADDDDTDDDDDVELPRIIGTKEDFFNTLPENVIFFNSRDLNANLQSQTKGKQSFYSLIEDRLQQFKASSPTEKDTIIRVSTITIS